MFDSTEGEHPRDSDKRFNSEERIFFCGGCVIAYTDLFGQCFMDLGVHALLEPYIYILIGCQKITTQFLYLGQANPNSLTYEGPVGTEQAGGSWNIQIIIV